MANSIHYTILAAVKTAIEGLNLTGIVDANIVIVKANKRLERIEFGIPSIAIFHGEHAEQYNGPASTNVMHEVGYPVEIFAFDVDRPSNEPSQTNEHDDYLYWRQQIVARFVDCALIPASQVCRTTIQSERIFSLPEWVERSVWASPLVFYFWHRLLRTG